MEAFSQLGVITLMGSVYLSSTKNDKLQVDLVYKGNNHNDYCHQDRSRETK